MMAAMTEQQQSGRVRGGPHSRACGIACQGHGTACSPDCPTCGGRPVAEGIAAPETAHVQVALDATGAHGTVVVDGTDLSKRVKAAHMSVTAGKPANIVLEANAAGFSYEGPGVVKLLEEVPTPWVPQARAWLADGVDWQGVQRAVAEGSMGASLGDAVRDVLLSELRRVAADTSGQGPS
jgi:hypothetical protein